MKKQNYTAPSMEQVEVRFEANIMSDVSAGVKGNMNVWNEQEI